MSLFQIKTDRFSLVFRISIAVFGGFLLANLSAYLVSLILTGSNLNNLVAGMLLGFVFYSAAIIVTFSVKTSMRAFIWVGASCLLCFIAINWIEFITTEQAVL
ncbi:hypothetical protein C2869_06680 [Saccharobesus litoralis]|uniref:DUF3649 domain-containing protein n=1 Tax=Saccharobesus litoralis TaxID=2172099 RepID=A0A2S0VPN0_9ALTE|nr:hypothetical protein [Saccharobesus litoralis]AWB66142.1 hypothetical protein C2869_06680 [Saccharobesus litoralis]